MAKKNTIALPVNQVLYGKAEDMIKTLPDRSVDLVVTSPPYAQVVSYGKGVECYDEDAYPDWFASLAKEIGRVLKDSGSFILNINDFVRDKLRSMYVLETICKIVRTTNLKLYDRYIWAKKTAIPAGKPNRLNDRIEYIVHFVVDPDRIKTFPDEARVPYSPSTICRMQYRVRLSNKVGDDGKTIEQRKYRKVRAPNPMGCIHSTVFDFNIAGAESRYQKRFHPAPFNEELPTFFIRWLTDRDDVVLDPFMGSGTTAMVCIKWRRKYIDFELNDKYKPEIDGRLRIRQNDLDSQFDLGNR